MASVFVASNRNKSSIELDLKSDEARATIRALIGRADCLVHNMRPTAARRTNSPGIRSPAACSCSEAIFLACPSPGLPYERRPRRNRL